MILLISSVAIASSLSANESACDPTSCDQSTCVQRVFKCTPCSKCFALDGAGSGKKIHGVWVPGYPPEEQGFCLDCANTYYEECEDSKCHPRAPNPTPAP